MRFIGITNSGENNCFLNASLQILYQLNSFHTPSFTSLLTSTSNTPLILILRTLLSNYQSSSMLNPNLLRDYLSTYFNQVSKFQLREPADCIEALMSILEIIHLEFPECNGNCLSHQLFHLEVFEQYECDCRATSEVLTWDFCTFSLNFYVDELVQVTTNHECLDLTGRVYQNVSEAVKIKGKFVELLKSQLENCKVPACTEDRCAVQSSKRRIHILKSSSSLIFPVVWYKQPSFLQVCKFLASVPQVLQAKRVSSGFANTQYLTGLVFYNRFHYFSYVFDQQWHKCDDTITRPLKSYYQVLEDALQSSFWPVALFYSSSAYKTSELTSDSIENLEKMSILLEIQKKLDEVVSFWTCECSATNEDSLLICHVCLKNRFSGFEWACDRCGQLNSELNKQCLSCRSFVFQPTQSSVFTKLNNFYFKSGSKTTKFEKNSKELNEIQAGRSQTTRFVNKEEKKKHQIAENEISTFKTARFGKEEEKDASQKGSNKGAVDRVMKESVSSSFGSCLKCKRKVRDKKLCEDCRREYWVCYSCGECWKINGQRCNCDLRTRTTRF